MSHLIGFQTAIFFDWLPNLCPTHLIGDESAGMGQSLARQFRKAEGPEIHYLSGLPNPRSPFCPPFLSLSPTKAPS